MEIKANLTHEKVLYSQDQDTHLVVSLTAPAMGDKYKRPPLCLMMLLDVSPSMMGEKLAYAKRSLCKMIDNLSAGDYCGIVSFSSISEILSRPILCTVPNKEELKRKVNDVQMYNGTNIADALLTGFELANSMDLSAEVLTRVILFTDGVANVGPAKTPAELIKLAESNLGIATCSAFGYGKDANQDFLLDLAKLGNGNFAFIENPDDALSAFGKELGGLLSTYATNLTIEVSPLSGHSITQVVSDVDAEEEELGQVSITFPDLLSEETRHIVLAFKLQSQKTAFPRDVNVVELKIGYDTLDANLKRKHELVDLKTKVRFVKAGEQQIAPNPELDKIVGLAQMVRAQLEAESFAKRGDYKSAMASFSGIQGQLANRGLNELYAVSNNLIGGYSSPSAYASSASFRTSVSRGATRGVGGSYDSTAIKALESLGVSLNTASQQNVAGTFTQADPSIAPQLDPLTMGSGNLTIGTSGIGTWNNSGTPDWTYRDPYTQPFFTGQSIFIGPGTVPLPEYPHTMPLTIDSGASAPPFDLAKELKKHQPIEKKTSKKIKQKSKRW